MLTKSRLPLLLFSCALAGCAADNLYIAHKANLGLNVAYNQTKPSGRFVLGYKEQFVTVIPKSAPLSNEAKRELSQDAKQVSNGAQPGDGEADAAPGSREAMAVLACSEIKVGIFELKEFAEYLATGTAARLHARKLVEGKDAASGDDSARVFAYRLRDALNAAVGALDSAIKTADDPSALTALKEKSVAQAAALSEVIDGPADTLSADIDALAGGDLKTTIDELAISGDLAVKAAGLHAQNLMLQRSAALAAAAPAGQIDKVIFNCFKNQGAS